MFGFEPFSTTPFSGLELVVVVMDGDIFLVSFDINTETEHAFKINTDTTNSLNINTLLEYEAER
jgi:hypothetical protein